MAKQAELVGRKRVLDSTALYDAMATQDTVTMIRSAIVALLKVADAALEAELGAALLREDDYRQSGKHSFAADTTAHVSPRLVEHAKAAPCANAARHRKTTAAPAQRGDRTPSRLGLGGGSGQRFGPGKRARAGGSGHSTPAS